MWIGAQGCHVTAHCQAASGLDGEHLRKTILLHKSCYLVREYNLSKSLQPSEADITNEEHEAAGQEVN